MDLIIIVVVGLALWAWTHFTSAGKTAFNALEARVKTLEGTPMSKPVPAQALMGGAPVQAPPPPSTPASGASSGSLTS